MIEIILLGLLSSIEQNAGLFEVPVRITSGTDPIDVTTGHAAPCVYDFDGDGVRDLLVGEFGAHPYKGPVSVQGDGSHSWVQGRLRIYRNIGTDVAPRFDGFEYFKAGGEVAAVPITCCVSFVPQFVDYDADGIDDVISASYPGDMYLWKGLGNGNYDKVLRLNDEAGDPVLPWKQVPEKYRKPGKPDRHGIHSTTVELHDLDGDEDLDMWIGSRLDGCFTIENTGTRELPVWSTVTKPVLDRSGQPVGGWDWGSNVHWHDWDQDGISDILIGSESGGVRWYRNVGNEGVPSWAEPVVLIPDMTTDQMFAKLEEPVRSASRCKVHATDWDGDGHVDLLVGDFGSKHRRIRVLTSEEKARLVTLEEELEVINKAGMPLWNPDSPLTPSQQRELERIEESTERIYEEMQALEKHEQTSHCWVWLYRRNPVEEMGVTP